MIRNTVRLKVKSACKAWIMMPIRKNIPEKVVSIIAPLVLNEQPMVKQLVIDKNMNVQQRRTILCVSSSHSSQKPQDIKALITNAIMDFTKSIFIRMQTYKVEFKTKSLFTSLISRADNQAGSPGCHIRESCVTFLFLINSESSPLVTGPT